MTALDQPPLLRRVEPDEVRRGGRAALDPEASAFAARVIAGVRAGGAAELHRLARRFGERAPGDPLVLDREQMATIAATVGAADREVLERAAARIALFAAAQRGAIRPLDVAVPGGRAGHTIEPVDSAGCYAPSGRYPLPSSALMTAVTARQAGCRRVVVASPGAQAVVVAGAFLAGADAFLALGGAHAVAALALGFEGLEPVDVIVGPGNKFVTAAKHLVSGWVGIDMLAGPSELLVLADDSADPVLVAADLLAQAEHDSDAVPMLITTSPGLVDAVERELAVQLGELSTREVAGRALRNGLVCVAPDLDRAIELADRLAPEHLELMVERPAEAAARVRHAGAVFLGSGSAEVFGDYGVGPNHTLPTGGTARFQAGLSVMHFLRLRTWMRLDGEPDPALAADTERLARLEGLAGHAKAAALRSV
jgi:phosphoribosyl-ATP pyrophosphohydrolase/phosphoribosyl-AMP cyclohydrolase/histidinol dehydrogenase